MVGAVGITCVDQDRRDARRRPRIELLKIGGDGFDLRQSGVGPDDFVHPCLGRGGAAYGRFPRIGATSPRPLDARTGLPRFPRLLSRRGARPQPRPGIETTQPDGRAPSSTDARTVGNTEAGSLRMAKTLLFRGGRVKPDHDGSGITKTAASAPSR